MTSSCARALSARRTLVASAGLSLVGLYAACGGAGAIDDFDQDTASTGGSAGAQDAQSGVAGSHPGKAGASGHSGGGLAVAGGAGGTNGSARGGAGMGGGMGGTTTGGVGGVCHVSSAGGSGGAPNWHGPSEICGNGLDDDGNGFIDEGCDCKAGTQACYGSDPGEIGRGPCKQGKQTCVLATETTANGWGPCVGAVYGSSEVCDGKNDENCDGHVDEGCGCCPGATETCGSSVGACKPGKRSCQANGAFGACVGGVLPIDEVCGNGIDDDCNGAVDDGCVIDVTLNIDGDCFCSAPCPPQAPYPVGCNIVFKGGNSQGCVAIAGSSVYFQEGVQCDAGHVSGQLFCSSQPGTGLDAQNCPINKSHPTYGSKPSDCAKIQGGKPGACYH